MADNQVTQSVLNRSRLNRFILILDLPEKLKEREDLFHLKNLQFTVTGTVFPPIQIHSHNIRFGGQSMNIPGFSRPEYPSLRVMFKIDNEWKNYMTIYHWINLFNNDKESIFDSDNLLKNNDSKSVIESYRKYVKDLSIVQLDEYNNKLIKFTYTDAYPVNLDGFNPDYQKGDEITCSAEFKYNQFIPEMVIND